MHFQNKKSRSESSSNFPAALGILRAPELLACVCTSETRSERVTECE